MAYTLIRRASSPNASSVGVSQFQISLGATPSLGSLLVLPIQWNSPSSIDISSVSDSAGNTWQACGLKGTQSDLTTQRFWACRVTSVGTGNLLVTINWTGGDAQFPICTLEEFSTTGDSLGFIPTVYAQGNSGPSVSPSYTTTFPEALVMSIIYGNVPVTSAEMTKVGPDRLFMSVLHRSRATQGTYTETASTTGNGGWGMLTIAFETVGGSAVAPTITSQPTSQTVTAPNPATFSVTATGTGPLTYQWSRGGVNISGATNSSYTLNPTSGPDSGATFQVVVTNVQGSVTSSTATLTVSTGVAAGFDFDTAPGCIFGQIVGSMVGISKQTGVSVIVRVYDASTGALVVSSGALTTNATTGRLPRWTSSSLALATEYILMFIRVSDGAIACKKLTTT